MLREVIDISMSSGSAERSPAVVKTLSVSINCSAAAAYRFLSVPQNFAKWASGLAESLRNVEGLWWADTPDGPVQIRFSEPNPFGVLDHWVHPGAGVPIYVPLRVVANGDACELMLTLFRQPDMSDERYEADAEWVLRDLNAAKRLLEDRAC